MHLRIGTASLNRTTKRRAPLALAAACLLTGAAGLMVTFERPHTLVPFEPVDYALLSPSELPGEQPTANSAPGGVLDGLQPGDALVAVIEAPTEAPVEAPVSARVSAAGGVGAAGAVPVTPITPVPTPEETAVADATPPPPTPEAPQAVAPPTGPSTGAPSQKVMTVQNGSGVQIIGGGASISTNKGTAPSATDSKKSAPTPTATPKAKNR